MSISARHVLTLTHFASTESRDGGGRCVIDLEDARFVDPYGLVAIACHITSAQMAGRDVQVLSPFSPQVATYLSRLGFTALYEGLDVEIDWPLPEVNWRPQSQSLMALQPFESMRSVDRLATLLWNQLEPHVDPQVVNALFEAVGEVGNNAIEHGYPEVDLELTGHGRHRRPPRAG